MTYFGRLRQAPKEGVLQHASTNDQRADPIRDGRQLRTRRLQWRDWLSVPCPKIVFIIVFRFYLFYTYHVRKCIADHESILKTNNYSVQIFDFCS
jgi:hypothetical protein